MKCFLFVIIILSNVSSVAQKFDSMIVPGSPRPVPDIVFSNTLNYKSSTISLSDYKGKLVILDFWGVFCSSCIADFPKLDSLQKEFFGEVQFILVNSINRTGEKKEKIQQFIQFRRNNNKIVPCIPIVVEDTLTKKYFPTGSVPHYAWIDPTGRLLALTSSEFVSRETIRNFLNSDRIIRQKKVMQELMSSGN